MRASVSPEGRSSAPLSHPKSQVNQINKEARIKGKEEPQHGEGKSRKGWVANRV
jgi:hypothetical protein